MNKRDPEIEELRRIGRRAGMSHVSVALDEVLATIVKVHTEAGNLPPEAFAEHARDNPPDNPMADTER
tara:strand:+ start:180 stop:383 length:204 start_codon:yes stop_codon:yes gene_type:complete